MFLNVFIIMYLFIFIIFVFTVLLTVVIQCLNHSLKGLCRKDSMHIKIKIAIFLILQERQTNKNLLKRLNIIVVGLTVKILTTMLLHMINISSMLGTIKNNYLIINYCNFIYYLLPYVLVTNVYHMLYHQPINVMLLILWIISYSPQ